MWWGKWAWTSHMQSMYSALWTISLTQDNHCYRQTSITKVIFIFIVLCHTWQCSVLKDLSWWGTKDYTGYWVLNITGQLQGKYTTYCTIDLASRSIFFFKSIYFNIQRYGAPLFCVTKQRKLILKGSKVLFLFSFKYCILGKMILMIIFIVLLYRVVTSSPLPMFQTFYHCPYATS